MPLQNRVNPFGELIAVPARDAVRQPRRAFPHRRKDTDKRRWAARQWICCVLDFKGRQRKSGAATTLSCSFSTNRRRSRQVIGRVSNAGGRTPKRLPRRGGSRASFRCGLMPTRWMKCCIGSGSTAKPSACIAGPSTNCRTAHSLRALEKRLPFAAPNCCAGRQMAIQPRSDARAVLSRMCSPRLPFFLRCRRGIALAGIRPPKINRPASPP